MSQKPTGYYDINIADLAKANLKELARQAIEQQKEQEKAMGNARKASISPEFLAQLKEVGQVASKHVLPNAIASKVHASKQKGSRER